jgi:hypothetical protein
MAMAALQFVTRIMEMEEKLDDSTLGKQLQDLNEELDEYLNGE